MPTCYTCGKEYEENGADICTGCNSANDREDASDNVTKPDETAVD